MDPIFAAIDRHRELAAAYSAALEANAPNAWRKSDELADQANILISTKPSTQQGAVALMRYIASWQYEQRPPFHDDDRVWEWHTVLLHTLADALS